LAKGKRVCWVPATEKVATHPLCPPKEGRKGVSYQRKREEETHFLSGEGEKRRLLPSSPDEKRSLPRKRGKDILGDQKKQACPHSRGRRISRVP